MHAAGRIGPNAITRVAEVLPARVGSTMTWALFERAGLLDYLRQPPQAMVDETEVRHLHDVLRRDLGWPIAREVSRAAGRRTADYLLGNRIPKLLQKILKLLPAKLAARVLLMAITRNAWTFVGSGHFKARVGRYVVLTIRDNPLCRGLTAEAPACDYYAATFEWLFRALVHKSASVIETDCEACGDETCRFEIRW